MPSTNYCVDFDAERRVRLNACEGEFALVEQDRSETGLWSNNHAPIMMTREQAMLLVDRLNRALGRSNERAAMKRDWRPIQEWVRMRREPSVRDVAAHFDMTAMEVENAVREGGTWLGLCLVRRNNELFVSVDNF